MPVQTPHPTSTSPDTASNAIHVAIAAQAPGSAQTNAPVAEKCDVEAQCHEQANIATVNVDNLVQCGNVYGGAGQHNHTQLRPD